MDYSPKLKKAMEQIKAVLKEHDIAAVVVLHTPGFSEYLNVLSPSYSCAEVVPGRINFKTGSQHYNGDKAKREKMVADTSNMMHHLSTVTGKISLGLLDASAMIDRAFESEHFGGGHTSHDQ